MFIVKELNWSTHTHIITLTSIYTQRDNSHHFTTVSTNFECLFFCLLPTAPK